MRHATFVGIFTLMLTLVPGLVFAEHVIDDSKEPSYLFVISGTSGFVGWGYFDFKRSTECYLFLRPSGKKGRA